VKKEITGLQGEITAVETIGKRDFARVTDDKLPSARPTCRLLSAPRPKAPAQLHERLRLNQQRLPHLRRVGLTGRPAPHPHG
jgi:small subunit ribosomal protein S6